MKIYEQEIRALYKLLALRLASLVAQSLLTNAIPSLVAAGMASIGAARLGGDGDKGTEQR